MKIFNYLANVGSLSYGNSGGAAPDSLTTYFAEGVVTGERQISEDVWVYVNAYDEPLGVRITNVAEFIDPDNYDDNGDSL